MIFNANDQIDGSIHWSGSELDIQAKVMWTDGNRAGVNFSETSDFKSKVQDFLAVEKISAKVKPMHQLGMELPVNLNYWYHADGPYDLYVWRHSNGGISKFQIIILDELVEWNDGEGLISGKIFSHRDGRTPLQAEDELKFYLDSQIDLQKINRCKMFVESIATTYQNAEATKMKSWFKSELNSSC